MPRFWEIDFARGLAVAMMVIFHFAWNLNYFGFIQENIYAGFWGLFQKATVTIFLLVVGTTLSISYSKNKKGYRLHFLKRGALVFCLGLLISAFTFIFFREKFIYFGILHLIGASIILSIPFAGRWNLNLLFGMIVLALPFVYNLQSIEEPLLVWLGFSTPFATLDYSPVFPWFGIILIGLSLGELLYPNAKRRIKIDEPKNLIMGFLKLLGTNSLLVYFTHQAILFPLVYVASALL